jgi:hypothetical protein
VVNATHGLSVYAHPFVKLLPCISRISNPLNGTDNTVNAGDTVQIIGENILIAGDSAEVGITFVSVTDPSISVHIPVKRFPVNKYKELQFVLPANTALGGYTIGIATQITTSKESPVQEVRKSIYSCHVTVLAMEN